MWSSCLHQRSVGSNCQTVALLGRLLSMLAEMTAKLTIALINPSFSSISTGVAYVKYDRASSAALAIENLHEVTLNDGHGPRFESYVGRLPTYKVSPFNSIYDNPLRFFIAMGGCHSNSRVGHVLQLWS